MRTLHEIWDELFEAAPSPAEESVMRNLTRLVDPADTSFLICALVVRFLFETLLLDPGSPVNIAGRANRAMQDLNNSAAKLDHKLDQLDQRLGKLSGSVFRTLEALSDARKFARERRKIPPPVLELDPISGSAHWQHTLAPNALWKIFLTCLLGTSLGGIFLLMLILAML